MADAPPPPPSPEKKNNKDLLQTQRRLPGRSGVVVAAPEAPGMSVIVNVLPSPSPNWRRQPEKQRSNASRQRGDQCIARGNRDGGTGKIFPSFKKGGTGRCGTHRVVPEGVDAACRSKMAPWAIKRAERARRQWGGEENGDEGALIPSLVGLRRRWMTRMRMTVVAGGTKQQPTP
jgi:hypothetical protein